MRIPHAETRERLEFHLLPVGSQKAKEGVESHPKHWRFLIGVPWTSRPAKISDASLDAGARLHRHRACPRRLLIAYAPASAFYLCGRGSLLVGLSHSLYSD